jgi:hypothetical protein
MPGVRALVVSLVAGVAVGLYFALWFGWPTFLSVAIGATLAIVMLLFAASLGDDPVAADAAWRAAAPDLAARERQAPAPAAPSEAPAAAGSDPAADRGAPDSVAP